MLMLFGEQVALNVEASGEEQITLLSNSLSAENAAAIGAKNADGSVYVL